VRSSATSRTITSPAVLQRRDACLKEVAGLQQLHRLTFHATAVMVAGLNIWRA
jgi:hypothetical protein